MRLVADAGRVCFERYDDDKANPKYSVIHDVNGLRDIFGLGFSTMAYLSLS